MIKLSAYKHPLYTVKYAIKWSSFLLSALILGVFVTVYILTDRDNFKLLLNYKTSLDVIYDITNSMALAVGILVFAAAVIQYRESTKARLAGVYEEIVSKYMTKEMDESRKALAVLILSHKGSQLPLGEHVHLTVDPLRSSAAQLENYMTHTRLLIYLEHVSVLIRRRYVSADDVLLMLGGVFSSCLLVYKYHIDQRQKEDKEFFANFIWCAEYLEGLDAKYKKVGVRRINLLG